MEINNYSSTIEAVPSCVNLGCNELDDALWLEDAIVMSSTGRAAAAFKMKAYAAATATLVGADKEVNGND